jgi:alpha-tubulin suppressor-like RCC1 family protein
LNGIKIIAISAGLHHSIVLSGNSKKLKFDLYVEIKIKFVFLDNGKVYTFGYGYYKQLGDGDTTAHNIATPYLVNALNGTNIIAISAGHVHSIVLSGNSKNNCF